MSSCFLPSHDASSHDGLLLDGALHDAPSRDVPMRDTRPCDVPSRDVPIVYIFKACSSIDLLVPASLDQLLLITKTLFTFVKNKVL